MILMKKSLIFIVAVAIVFIATDAACIRNNTEIKNISNDDNSNRRSNDPGRIIFRDDVDDDAPFDLTTKMLATTTEVSNAIVNRIALTAPDMCLEGELQIEGKCRKQVKF